MAKIRIVNAKKTKKNWKPIKPVVLSEITRLFFFNWIEELKKINIDVNNPKINE